MSKHYTPGFAHFRPGLIISGSQRGTDYGALLGAKACGIPTGGVAPKGWKTESGPKPEMGNVFGLVESASSDYAVRTRENIEICDAVLLIASDFNSTGSKLTYDLTHKSGKPIFQVAFSSHAHLEPDNLIEQIRYWLEWHEPAVLNVAGNRESKARGIERWTHQLMMRIFLDD